MTDSTLLPTPFTAVHEAAGAKMAPFAGYTMPINYAAGILAEHTHTRSAASLFDVSHMGQCILDGPMAASSLEKLVPSAIADLPVGKQRYTVLLNDNGGVIDDLMVLRQSETRFFLVVNASRKEQDFALLRAELPAMVTMTVLKDHALVALQGPLASQALQTLVPTIDALPFMMGTQARFEGQMLTITRSGYTGEDGFEISVPAALATKFAAALEKVENVKWAGLGARDSLRLEAGLCLYGHELTEEISPIEADLGWIIQRRRREEGGFPGDSRILRELAEGTKKKRVGIKPEGKAPARDGVEVQDLTGKPIGTITSGGFGPSVGGPIAMGYVEAKHAAPNTKVQLVVRGQALPATITALPFTPHNYRK